MKTITKALTDHHNEMRKLVKEVKKDSTKFIFLKKHLDVHHELDESLESQEEHVLLNQALIDLNDFPKDNDRWMVKFKVFEELLDHHLTEEEEELFPDAEKLMNEKELTEIGGRFEELKKIRLDAALETKPVKELEKPK